jgi:ribonuclease P/MRP protein subunit POP7
MSLVKRVTKRLESTSAHPINMKGLPLAQRVAALAVTKKQLPSTGEDEEEGELLVVGTGKAITKTLHVAAWFSRRKEYVVCIRTRTVGVIDDVVLEETEDGEEDADEAMGERRESRVRRVSCLEVGIRLRT